MILFQQTKDRAKASLLRHQLHLCTRTPTAPWSLRCAGRVVEDRSRQQHKNGPVGRLYLWKEWSTHTAVDASSTQTLTFPFSSSHNVHSLPPRIEPLVLLWISKNLTGGFPETHLAISVKGILSPYSFLFLDTPGHYWIRKYMCWCKNCSLVCGRGHDTESRGQSLHVSGCLCSNLTVWKEEQLIPDQGIKQWETRVTEWVVKSLSLVNPGVWGCVQTRTQWSTEEDAHMWPGYHWMCEFGDAGNDTSCVKQFHLLHRTWEDYGYTSLYKGDRVLVISWSRDGSTEWRRMCQDSRSKSGHRTLTHHDHVWLCWSTPVN